MIEACKIGYGPESDIRYLHVCVDPLQKMCLARRRIDPRPGIDRNLRRTAVAPRCAIDASTTHTECKPEFSALETCAATLMPPLLGPGVAAVRDEHGSVRREFKAFGALSQVKAPRPGWHRLGDEALAP